MILEKIKKEEKGKVIDSFIDELLKQKKDYTDSDYISDYSSLIFILFASDYDTSILKEILSEFKNNTFIDYNTWTWIKPLILLNAYVNENDESLVKTCKETISNSLNIGNELQVEVNNNVFQRVLKGEVFHDDEIKKLREEEEFYEELEIILKTIMQLIVIIVMGASKEFTIKDAEIKLKSLKLRVVEIINLDW